MKTPKGWTAKEYADHMLWLSGFTGAKDVQSGIKRKVQRKTNKPVKSRKNNVQPKVQWFDKKRTYNLVEAVLDKTNILRDIIS